MSIGIMKWSTVVRKNKAWVLGSDVALKLFGVEFIDETFNEKKQLYSCRCRCPLFKRNNSYILSVKPGSICYVKIYLLHMMTREIIAECRLSVDLYGHRESDERMFRPK